MKLLVLLCLISLSLVSTMSVRTPELEPRQAPPKAPDAKTEDPPKDQPPAPAAGGDGKLIAKDGTCGGEDLICDYGLICQPTGKKGLTCQPLKVKMNESEFGGPCKADKTCNEGLSCSTEKSGSGAEKSICINSPTQGGICKDGNRSTPCAKGYECNLKDVYSGGVIRCNAGGYVSISGPSGACGEGTQAECGPGLECVENPQIKAKVCKILPLKYAADNKLPKGGEKCQGEYGKEGVCAAGLVCMPKGPGGKDRKENGDGVCHRLGLQGELCEDKNNYKRACTKDYECVSKEFTPLNEKYCMKKGHKFVVPSNYGSCGPETQNFCAPGFECIDSKVKYPGKKVCLKKGEKETNEGPALIAATKEILVTMAAGKPGVLELPTQGVLTKLDAKAEEKENQEKKPE